MRFKSIKLKIFISFSILFITLIFIFSIGVTKIGKVIIRNIAQNYVATLAEDDSKIVLSRMETLIKELSVLGLQEEIISMDLDEQIQTLKEQLPKTSFLDMAIVQMDGKASYTDGSEADLGDREYIQKALNGEANISDVILSKVTGKPVIMVAVPIKQGDSVVGALIGRMDGNSLSQIATDAGYGEEGFAFMINSSGQIIAHKDSEHVLNEINPIEQAKNDKTYASLAKAEQTMLDKGNGFTTYIENGKVIYAGFVKVTGTDWTIVVTATQSEAEKPLDTFTINIFIFALTCLAPTICVALIIGNAITKSINIITKYSEKIASLDISENVPNKYLNLKDENGILARAMQSITDNLRNIIGEITDSSMKVSTTAQELTVTSEHSALAAEEVSKTVEEIAKGATEQASNTEIGSSQAIKLGGLFDRNREQVIKMNHTSDKITEVVNGGMTDIEHLADISEENSAATKEIYDIILKTNESTAQIGEASNVIASIAQQTNLLSLNASIEAARAGEAGKGFAVVASEIKKLAGQSAQSTDYINGIVGELQAVVTKAVESIERVNEISKEQFESVINTKQKYEAIREVMEDTEDAISQLSESEDEMLKAKNDILDMLQTLSAIAQENAASTEEASSAMMEQSTSMEEVAISSEKLAQLAGSLQEIIARFKANI